MSSTLTQPGESLVRELRPATPDYSGYLFFVEDPWKGGLLRVRYEGGVAVGGAYLGAGGLWVDPGLGYVQGSSPWVKDGHARGVDEAEARAELVAQAGSRSQAGYELAPGLYDEAGSGW